MANLSFKIGDIVQLKSGGPKMTVNHTHSESIGCRWFAGAKLEEGSFNQSALQPYVEAPAPAPKDKK